MTTLIQWQADKVNLFEVLDNQYQVAYLEDTTPSSMNFLLISKFGQRKLRSMFENESVEVVAEHLHNIYGKKWANDYAIYKSIMEMESDVQATATDESSATIGRTTNTNQTNKTTGFDSEELVTNDGTDISGNDETETATRNTHTNSTLSQSGAMEKSSFNRRHKFFDSIIYDISTLLVLPIY